MFKSLVDLLGKLSPVDMVLLGVVFISFLLKIGKDVFILFWSRHIEKKSNSSCKFLKSIDSGPYCCINPIYMNKTFVQRGNRCPSTVCRGYRAENIDGENIIRSSVLFSFLIIGIDWVIHLASLVLVIRTLLGVTSA